MQSDRKSWYQKEQEENPRILKKFWDMRVQGSNKNIISIANIKDMFLVGLPPENMNREEWTNKLNQAWNDGSAFKDFDTFYEFFKHVPSMKPVAIEENLMPKEVIEVGAITKQHLNDIQQYTQDKTLSVVGVLGSARSNHFESFSSNSNKTSDVFSLQSVGKVFTGILALQMIREGIISEKDFAENKIQIDNAAKSKLTHAPLILDRLNEVTLHQALTHNGGFASGGGDFVGNYGDKIQETDGKITSEIKSTNDFLQFVPNQIFPFGCDLISVSSHPSTETLNSLPIKSNAAYVRYKEQLFYVNKEKQECLELNVTPIAIERFDKELMPTAIPRQLSREELNQVQSITAHTHFEGYHYSNTGMLLGGLSLEFHYNKYRKEHHEKGLEPLDFNGLMEKYVIRPSGISYFETNPPEEFKYNRVEGNAKYIAGNPAGGSFTTTEDLAKFGKWIYDECQKGLVDLIDKYGQEFCHNKIIEHAGDAPSGSSYFLLNLQTGNMVIAFNDQRRLAASEVGRAVNENIFSMETDKHAESSKLNSSTVVVSKKLNIKLASPSYEQVDVENKKDRHKKLANDDIALHSAKEKKASQEFASKSEKKRPTSTDDFNITYGKRSGK